MRLNAKTARMLRRAAEYHPGQLISLPFPGVARNLRRVPVMVPASGTRRARPLLENGEVKTELVPVTRPARLAPKTPKAVYRTLKRLYRKGLLKAAAYGGLDAVEKAKEEAAT